MFPPIDASMLASVGVGVCLEQRDRAHDLPALTVAALHDVLVHPGVLHGATHRILADGLDGHDRSLADERYGSMQERVATPATCTVQAPHALMPQPYLVPVIFKSSRSTQSSGVEGSTVTSLRAPLTLSVIRCHG